MLPEETIQIAKKKYDSRSHDLCAYFCGCGGVSVMTDSFRYIIVNTKYSRVYRYNI